jgi:hypothetical protein
MNAFSLSFKKSLFSPIDLFDIGTRFVNSAGAKVSQDPKGARVVDTLKTTMGVLNNAIEREKANPYTVQINETDRKRDDFLLTIRDSIKANTHNTMNSDVQNAATTLFTVFNVHIGKLSSMGISAENNAVKYFLENLVTGENKERCTLLNLDPLIVGLTETQIKLEALYVERTRLQTEMYQYNLKNAVQSAVNAIRRFLGYMDIMVVSDDQDFIPLGSEVRSILSDVEAIAHSRKTRSENNVEKEPDMPLNQAA